MYMDTNQPDERATAMAYHYFTECGEAYDASQCDEEIATGDCLIIQDPEFRGVCKGRDEDGFRVYEHADKPISLTVVALSWAWPIAVTVADGEMHGIEEDTGAYARVIEDAKFTPAQIQAAVGMADKIGAPVRPLFRAWLAAQVQA